MQRGVGAPRGEPPAPRLDLGLVVTGHGRHYTVERPRGRGCAAPRAKTGVVGDHRVRWMPTSSGEGVIRNGRAAPQPDVPAGQWKTKSFPPTSTNCWCWWPPSRYSANRSWRALIAARPPAFRRSVWAQQDRPADHRRRAPSASRPTPWASRCTSWRSKARPRGETARCSTRCSPPKGHAGAGPAAREEHADQPAGARRGRADRRSVARALNSGRRDDDDAVVLGRWRAPHWR